jgi:hypothetical protein
VTDEYAPLRAAFAAGATIQAYTVEGDDGRHPLWNVAPHGYWRDLSCDGEPKFSCHPTRYRVKDHHPAEAPVALMDLTAPPKVWLQIDTDGDNEDRSEAIPRDSWGQISWCYESIGGQEVVYIRQDIANAEVAALRAEVEAMDRNLAGAMDIIAECDKIIARVRALADEFAKRRNDDDATGDEVDAYGYCEDKLRAALEGS